MAPPEDRRTVYVSNQPDWQEKVYGSVLDKLEVVARKFRFIAQYLPLEDPLRPLTILEIGCAYGHYLQVLRFLNPSHVLYGVEIARDAVDACCETLGPDHVFWQSGSEPVPLPDNSVDLIFSYDVVEHVPREGLISLLKEANRLLAPDGYLFIETPNCGRIMRWIYRLQGQRWIYDSKEHCSPFSRGAFEQLVSPFLNLERSVIRDDSRWRSRFLRRLEVSRYLMFVLRKRK